MHITKIAEGAFFVTSYSTQTIAPAYDTGTTIQALTPNDVQADVEPDQGQQQVPVQEPAPR